MIYGVLDMSPAMIDPIKGLAKLATVKFTSVFETLLVAQKRAKMTDFVLKGLANGTLKPVIDKTFPLENIVEAHRYLESNQHVGKSWSRLALSTIPALPQHVLAACSSPGHFFHK
jgi:NADPH2:quinone reductase